MIKYEELVKCDARFIKIMLEKIPIDIFKERMHRVGDIDLFEIMRDFRYLKLDKDLGEYSKIACDIENLDDITSLEHLKLDNSRLFIFLNGLTNLKDFNTLHIPDSFTGTLQLNDMNYYDGILDTLDLRNYNLGATIRISFSGYNYDNDIVISNNTFNKVVKKYKLRIK